MKIKHFLTKIKAIQYYIKGKKYLNDPHYITVQKEKEIEAKKRPRRTEIINFLLTLKQKESIYLEIGVRNPNNNFNQIKASKKYSVDPGVEFKENPVDFKMTSDEFFEKLYENKLLANDIKFDVIFIDGLHLANQVDRDISNALKFINDDGFIVLHDCNPLTEWHARENYNYHFTPARGIWNGTTWKAFLKWRFNPLYNSCCIDSDLGVGIISKNHQIGKSIKPTNLFFEFSLLEENRREYLNLIDFKTFKKSLIFKKSAQS